MKKSFLLIAVFSFLLSFHTTTRAAQPEDFQKGAELARDWIDRTAAFYDEHPELQILRGSMWKHFTNIQHFVKMRTVNGVLPTAADRMLAWEFGQFKKPLRMDERGGWFSIGPPNISGRIVDIKFHPTNPQILYAASAGGGLWISNNGGDTWRTTTDQLPSISIGAVCVLPTDPDVVLVGTGESVNWPYVIYGVGIWKSTDAGETWSPTSLNYEITDNHGFHVMVANPITGTILTGSNDGMWRSTDAGDTWTQVLPAVDYYDVKWKPGSGTRVYAGRGSGSYGDGVIVSDDDGLTWTPAGSGQPPTEQVKKTRIGVTEADPNMVYAHYGSHGVYRSTDNGATWTPRNTTVNISQSQGSYAVTIAVDPDDAQRVIAGGIQLYLSTDGGSTFAETGGGNPLGDDTRVHVDHHAAAWEPGSTSNLWVGSDGGVWRSTDNGDTWNNRSAGLITTQYYDVCIDQADPEFTMAGAQDNGLPWVEEEDEPWFPSTLLADGLACIVEGFNTNTIYSEWQFGNHIRSDDRGQSWQATMNGITGTSIPFAPLDLDPSRAGHLYTSTSHGIFKTTNGQDLWVNVDGHEASWISISPVDGDIVWTVTNDAVGYPVHVTTDDGDTWTTASWYGFPVGNETKILADPVDPGTAYVTFAGYSGVAHVARTTDLGATWEDVSGNFPPDPANTMEVDPDGTDHWFVGTDSGMWYSPNSGVTWTRLGVGFPNVVVYDLEIKRAARKLVATTYGRGTWEINMPIAVTGSPATATHHPDLMLDPPSANSSTDGVSFRFASRAEGQVTIDVYDDRGGKVERVVDFHCGDGIIREFLWQPDELPAGVYSAVLRGGSETLSRRFIVEK